MKAIILAAGRGTRLKGLTTETPKTLLEIQGKPIIDYIIGSLHRNNITDIVIVGGFCFEKLQDALKKYQHTFVYNEKFNEGNLLTLLKAQDEFTDDLVITNADHIFSPSIIEKMIESIDSSGIFIACDKDRPLSDDDMKVQIKEGVFNLSKQHSSWDYGYIGMTGVSKDKLKIYKTALHEELEDVGKNANIESVINRLSIKGHLITPVLMDPDPWYEVDNEEDLNCAKRGIEKHKTLFTYD